MFRSKNKGDYLFFLRIRGWELLVEVCPTQDHVEKDTLDITKGTYVYCHLLSLSPLSFCLDKWSLISLMFVRHIEGCSSSRHTLHIQRMRRENGCQSWPVRKKENGNNNNHLWFSFIRSPLWREWHKSTENILWRMSAEAVTLTEDFTYHRFSKDVPVLTKNTPVTKVFPSHWNNKNAWNLYLDSRDESLCQRNQLNRQTNGPWGHDFNLKRTKSRKAYKKQGWKKEREERHEVLLQIADSLSLSFSHLSCVELVILGILAQT